MDRCCVRDRYWSSATAIGRGVGVTASVTAVIFLAAELAEHFAQQAALFLAAAAAIASWGFADGFATASNFARSVAATAFLLVEQLAEQSAAAIFLAAAALAVAAWIGTDSFATAAGIDTGSGLTSTCWFAAARLAVVEQTRQARTVLRLTATGRFARRLTCGFASTFVFAVVKQARKAAFAF